jgi:hypothetical protein
VTKKFRKIVGIFSASKTGDNNHMWINYANDYHGFCIGYDFEELRDYLRKGLGSFGGDVKYWDTYPVIIPDIDKNLTDLYQLCFTKLRQWEPEDENRILKFKFVNRKWSIRSSIIKEIIIGQNMFEAYKINLLHYVYHKYPECKLLYANKPNSKDDIKARLIEFPFSE